MIREDTVLYFPKLPGGGKSLLGWLYYRVYYVFLKASG